MDNLDFIKKVMTSDDAYWIACMTETVNHYGTSERRPDSVWLICIPYDIRIGQKPEELLLKDVEAASRTDVHNIAMSENFAPFQSGIRLSSFHFGFPIPSGRIKEFTIKALQVGTNKILDYKKIIDEMEAAPVEANQLQTA